ncbi:isoprenoid synthase domain-containing protein [Mycena rebaudengoi]|nr:isoprenoid synthase domain-containing protein [Mycena rebaudengoi]
MDNLPSTFHLPPLKKIAARFERTDVHPLREQAKIEAFKWLSSYEGLDKRWLGIVMQTRSDYMAALMYPDVDLEDLVLTTKWFSWGFFIDDIIDRKTIGSKEIEDLVQLYEDVQFNRDGLGGEKEEPEPLVIQMFRSIWNKVREKKRPGWERLFAEASLDYVRGLPGVNEFRTAQELPTIQEYKVNRRRVLFFEAVFHYTGLIYGLNVDPAVVRSPEVTELYASLTEFGWLFNDVFSWNVDQRIGDYVNFVSLLIVHERKTLQDAMDDAGAQIREQLARWDSAKMRVLETFREHPDIKDLTELAERNERGIWLAVGWSWAAGERYLGGREALEEADITGLVHVMPRQRDSE